MGAVGGFDRQGGDAPAAPSTPSTYVSGERVFGPPVGTFDVEWVTRQIERETPASFDEAHSAVAAAWAHARQARSLDVDDLARAAQAVGVSAQVGGAVATQVVAYCAAYHVD